MADNIFEQLVKDNREIIISEDPNLTLIDQEKLARRSPSKITKNLDKIRAITNQAVDFIVNEKNKISIPAIDNNEEVFKQSKLQNLESIQKIISDEESENIIQNTASRIDYIIAQEVENTITNSSALDNYRYKKDPYLFSKEHDMSEAIVEEANRTAANISYIAKVDKNKQNNEEQIKNLLK